MTQHELVLKWIDKYGKITPAKMSGTPWGGGFFGSETSKRCRELRKKGLLDSERDGRFEVFYRARYYGIGAYEPGGYEYEKQEKENKEMNKAVELMKFPQQVLKF